MALGLVDTVSEMPANQSSTHQSKITNSDGVQQSGSNDLVSTHVMKILQNFIAAQCDATFSLQPLYYHIGCAFFLLAFLAPSYRYGPALYMRCMLTFGCILFLMWSYLVECRPDVLLWTLLFILVNIIHMAILICKLRPVKFEKEIEEVSKLLLTLCVCVWFIVVIISWNAWYLKNEYCFVMPHVHWHLKFMMILL